MSVQPENFIEIRRELFKLYCPHAGSQMPAVKRSPI